VTEEKTKKKPGCLKVGLGVVLVGGGILALLAGLMAGGDGDTEQSATSGAATSSAKPTSSPAKRNVLEIKGVSIGMNISDVPAILAALGDTWEVSDVKNGEEELNEVGLAMYKIRSGGFFVDARNKTTQSFMNFTVSAGKDGKVKFILIPGPYAEVLFKAKEMEASEFVEAFAKGYKIPIFEVKDDMSGWYYTSPNGYKISIDTEKTIEIERTATAQESANAFD